MDFFIEKENQILRQCFPDPAKYFGQNTLVKSVEVMGKSADGILLL